MAGRPSETSKVAGVMRKSPSLTTTPIALAHALHGAHVLAARRGLAGMDAGTECGGDAEHGDEAGGEQPEAGGDPEVS